MAIFRLIFVSTACFFSVAISTAGESWTDKTGKFNIEAEFVTLRGDQVVLRRADGKSITVPLVRLSAKSAAMARARSQMASAIAKSGDSVSGKRSIEETIEILNRAEFHDLNVFWNSLPKSYQSDCNDLVRAFASVIDEETWLACSTPLDKLNRIFIEKKGLTRRILLKNNQAKELQVLQGLSRLVDAVCNTSVTKQAKMRRFDGSKFFADDFLPIKRELIAILRRNEQESGNALRQVPEFELLSKQGDVARVRSVLGKNSTTQNFVRVEGRWIPEVVRDNWETGINVARKFIEALSNERSQKAIKQIRRSAIAISLSFDQVLAATDEKSLDEAVSTLRRMVDQMSHAAKNWNLTNNSVPRTTNNTTSQQTLQEARKGFVTHVVRSGDSEGAPDSPAKNEFQLIRYRTSVGPLAAYVTKDPGDRKKHPAIVWITGGDCNSIGDVWSPRPRRNDQSASPFRKAGIVMMFPSLRGGNDNPGQREGFYGEVQDILAATDHLAKLPCVDPSRIYLGGRSTGGTLVSTQIDTAPFFPLVLPRVPADTVATSCKVLDLTMLDAIPYF